ncbi:MAG: hypothetical protein ACM31O_01715 [Bacteroidota bacterium]
MSLIVSCPHCSAREDFELLMEALDEPKLQPERGDMALQALRCSVCDGRFYPLARVGGEIISNLFNADGTRYEGATVGSYQCSATLKFFNLLPLRGMLDLSDAEERA